MTPARPPIFAPIRPARRVYLLAAEIRYDGGETVRVIPRGDLSESLSDLCAWAEVTR